MLGSVDRVLANRRLTTPVVLRAGMVLLCLPILALGGAIANAVATNDEAVETVGEDATSGIAVAQEIKANLAELDELVVRSLLTPGSRAELTERYSDQRRDLHDSLTLAASEAPPGAAYELPLVNIDYALGHYHALVGESFAALDRDDRAAAVSLYGRAHEVMATTLLPEADFFDKANTYVLNTTYDQHRDDAETDTAGVIIAGSVLVGILVAVQLYMARRFRRIFNPALLAATVLAIALCALAAGQLKASAEELATAREESFDSVHLLARARATAVTARQAQGHRLLDPANQQAAEAFGEQAAKLFRVPEGDAAAIAAELTGSVPEGAGGFLAAVVTDELAASRPNGPVWDSLHRFGAYLQDDADLRDLVDRGSSAQAVGSFVLGTRFTSMTNALDTAQVDLQAQFDEHAEAAADATWGLRRVSQGAIVLILGLTLAGLYMRLREYRG